MQTLDSLNNQFGSETVRFSEMAGGLIAVDISNSAATAKLSLHGAHVMAFQPKGQEPVLWMSESSFFEEWKPIRGGIPVCWPWFGGHPTDADKPAHGFARLAEWSVISVDNATDSETTIVLGLNNDSKTEALWPYAFDVKLTVTVSEKLSVSLAMNNTGSEPFTITSALHTYFNISNIKQIAIKGFDGKTFIDTLDDSEHVQQGDITFAAETDLVMLDSEGPFVIEDNGLNRSIRIENSGSKTAVVWNPWAAKAQRMPDFGAEEYHGMVCVETTNAQTDEQTIAPGSTHVLSALISIA